MSRINEEYTFENMPDVPYEMIDVHSDLCYHLLHIKHGTLSTLDIPIKALEIISVAQKPLLDTIEEVVRGRLALP